MSCQKVALSDRSDLAGSSVACSFQASQQIKPLIFDYAPGNRRASMSAMTREKCSPKINLNYIPTSDTAINNLNQRRSIDPILE